MARAAVLALALSVGGAAQADGDADGPPVSVGPDRPTITRHAVVIGNADYRFVNGLGNAGADAALVAGFLAAQGYAVREYRDLDKAGFERALRRILLDVGADSEVVFYFAGHGVQIAGGNYLVPVDANLDDAYDVPFETVSLTSVVKIVAARARRQIVILDSCRDNPFGATRVVSDLGGGLVETRDGFSALTAPINALLSFSTSPGALAYEGAGANSFFTDALVRAASAAPEAPLDRIFADVRRDVYTRTGGRQVPWESSTLVDRATFAGSVAGAPSDAARGPSVVPGEAPAPVASFAGVTGDGTVRLEGPLGRHVAIGAGLGAGFGLGGEASVSVSAPPRSGRLALRLRDGRLVETGRAELDGASATDLIYIADLRELPGAGAPRPALVDRFSLAVNGVERPVEIALDADPCDREAGDHLDPDGVGLARYPNEIAPAAALEACRAAVEAQPDVGRFHYQLGRSHLAQRELLAARSAFERAATLGHARALVALGSLIANAAAATGGGANAPAPEEALARYRAGVERGDPYAYHALGKQLLRHGLDDAQRREGFDLLSRAVELGHTFSMNELGYYFLDADAPDTDPARGLRYLQESAARNDIYGFNNLGLVHRDGLAGVPKDPKAAEAWFRKAADGGHPYAPGNLGRLWNSGALGTNEQYRRAVEWYDIGLERGDGGAGANAAWIILNRDVRGLGPRDAALRAAKAATLRAQGAAERAREILAQLPSDALDGAAQMLVNALGGEVAVDGAFGPQSVAEADRAMAALGEERVGTDPLDRLIQLAAAYWRQRAFRVDLY